MQGRRGQPDRQPRRVRRGRQRHPFVDRGRQQRRPHRVRRRLQALSRAPLQRQRQHGQAQQGAERRADAGVGTTRTASRRCRTTRATCSNAIGTARRGCASRRPAAAPTTYTFFGHNEEEVTDGVTTAVSYYSFGGLRIAVKRGSTL